MNKNKTKKEGEYNNKYYYIKNIMEVLERNNLTKEVNKNTNQNSFLESTLGQTINAGLDIGLRVLLPDLIENQVIDVKNAFLKEGFSKGVQQIVTSAIDFGKSALGIITGNFENVSQVQTAVKNRGIIDGVSNLLDFVLNKTSQKGIIPTGIASTIRKGKNIILNNISNNIENEFNKQLSSIEKVQKYSNNWKSYFNNKDLDGMDKEYNKIRVEIKSLIPLENTLKQVRNIENLHKLIKSNGGNFNLTNDQMELAKMLA